MSVDWVKLLKVLFGFVTLLVLAYLVKTIGMGSVEEKSSFGLKEVVQPIGTVFILWGAWAYPDDEGQRIACAIPASME